MVIRKGSFIEILCDRSRYFIFPSPTFLFIFKSSEHCNVHCGTGGSTRPIDQGDGIGAQGEYHVVPIIQGDSSRLANDRDYDRSHWRTMHPSHRYEKQTNPAMDLGEAGWKESTETGRLSRYMLRKSTKDESGSRWPHVVTDDNELEMLGKAREWPTNFKFFQISL